MTWPISVSDFGIVFRPLINILDHEADRRAGGHLTIGAVIFKDTGEDLDLIRLTTLGYETAGPRAALVQELLDPNFVQRQSGGAAVDDTSDCTPMTLAPGCHAKHMSKCVMRHEGRSVV